MLCFASKGESRSLALYPAAAAIPMKAFSVVYFANAEIKSKRPNGCLCAARALVFVYPLQIDADLPGPRAWYSILHTPSTSSAPQLNLDSDKRPIFAIALAHTALKINWFESGAKNKCSVCSWYYYLVFTYVASKLLQQTVDIKGTFNSNLFLKLK